MDSNSFAGHAPNQELEKEAMMMNTAALVSFLTSRGYSKEITPNLAIDLQDYLSTGNGAHGSEDNHKEGKPRLLASTSRGTKEREITKTKTNTKINASTNMNTNTNTDMIAHAHASTKTPAHTSSGTEGVSDLAIRVGLDRQTHVQHQLLSTLHNREVSVLTHPNNHPYLHTNPLCSQLPGIDG